MKCNRCGSENSVGSRFCENCGGALSQDSNITSFAFQSRSKNHPKQDKILTIAFAVVNAFIIFSFFLISWFRISVPILGNYGGSAFRIILLVGDISKVAANANMSGMEMIYGLYFLFVIPILAIWSITCLFKKGSSIQLFYQWSKITFITTIAIIGVIILAKYIILQYSSIAYIGSKLITLDFGAIMSFILCIVGVLLPKLLPKLLNEGINFNIDDVKKDIVRKFNETENEDAPIVKNEMSPEGIKTINEMEMTLENGEILLQTKISRDKVMLNGEEMEYSNIYGLLEGDIIKVGNVEIKIYIPEDKLAQSEEILEEDSDETVILGNN